MLAATAKHGGYLQEIGAPRSTGETQGGRTTGGELDTERPGIQKCVRTDIFNTDILNTDILNTDILNTNFLDFFLIRTGGLYTARARGNPPPPPRWGRTALARLWRAEQPAVGAKAMVRIEVAVRPRPGIQKCVRTDIFNTIPA